MSTALPCPLCAAPEAGPFVEAHGRTYHECGRCRLLFMTPDGHPPPDEERARYASHENDPGDPRYRRFLDRLALPLSQRLEPGARGLDYGSGPGPTLSVMMGERGFPMVDYDPFFAPDPTALAGPYDFVTCTETAEHFFDPAAEFRRLDALVRPGGWLGIMSEWPPWEDDPPMPEIGWERIPRPARSPEARAEDFARWYYVRDPTHVVFYPTATMRWLGAHLRWEVHFPRRNVVLFRKRGRAPGESPPALGGSAVHGPGSTGPAPPPGEIPAAATGVPPAGAPNPPSADPSEEEA